MMKHISIVFFLFSSHFLFGQEVLIKGTGKVASNNKVYACFTSDALTQNLTIVSQTTANAKGEFELKIPTKQKENLYLCTSNAQISLWISPKQTYDVEFLSADTTVTQNGLIRNFEARIENNSSDRTNAIIGQINNEVAKFLSENSYDYLLLNSKQNEAATSRMQENNPKTDLVKFNSKEDSSKYASAQVNFLAQIESLENKMQLLFGSEFKKDSFLQNYAACEIFTLRLLANAPVSLETVSKVIDLKNSAFIKWLELSASNYLNPTLNTRDAQAFTTLMTTAKSAEPIIHYLNPESTHYHPLEELILIAALRKNYYTRAHSPALMKKILSMIQSTSEFETSKQLAKACEIEFSILKKNSALPDFTLINSNNDKWKFSEHCDRNMYLYFFNESKASQRDLALLNHIASKYKNDFRIVVIGMQDTFESFEKTIASLKLENMEVLYGGNDFKLIQDLRIGAVPSAIQTNFKGLLQYEYTPLPAEGIQQKWEEILRKNKK
jgi:hypothetical protein